MVGAPCVGLEKFDVNKALTGFRTIPVPSSGARPRRKYVQKWEKDDVKQ